MSSRKSPTIRLTIEVLPLAEENARGANTSRALEFSKGRKFALPVQWKDTFAQVWQKIEQRHVENYLDAQQATMFSIKKLQDSYDCDLDLRDTVSSIFGSETDPAMRTIKVVPAFVGRDFSVPITTHLRPAHAQKRARQSNGGPSSKRQRVEQLRNEREHTSFSQDQPVASTEHSTERVEQHNSQGERHVPRSETADSLVFMHDAQTGQAEFAPQVKQEPRELSPSSIPPPTYSHNGIESYTNGTELRERVQDTVSQSRVPETQYEQEQDEEAGEEEHEQNIGNEKTSTLRSPQSTPTESRTTPFRATSYQHDIQDRLSSPDFLHQAKTTPKPKTTYSRTPRTGTTRKDVYEISSSPEETRPTTLNGRSPLNSITVQSEAHLLNASRLQPTPVGSNGQESSARRTSFDMTPPQVHGSAGKGKAPVASSTPRPGSDRKRGRPRKNPVVQPAPSGASTAVPPSIRTPISSNTEVKKCGQSKMNSVGINSHGDTWSAPAAGAPHSPTPQSTEPFLGYKYELMTLPALRQIAESRGLSVKGYTKSLIKRIRDDDYQRHWATPERPTLSTVEAASTTRVKPQNKTPTAKSKHPHEACATKATTPEGTPNVLTNTPKKASATNTKPPNVSPATKAKSSEKVGGNDNVEAQVTLDSSLPSLSRYQTINKEKSLTRSSERAVNDDHEQHQKTTESTTQSLFQPDSSTKPRSPKKATADRTKSPGYAELPATTAHLTESWNFGNLVQQKSHGANAAKQAPPAETNGTLQIVPDAHSDPDSESESGSDFVPAHNPNAGTSSRAGGAAAMTRPERQEDIAMQDTEQLIQAQLNGVSGSAPGSENNDASVDGSRLRSVSAAVSTHLSPAVSRLPARFMSRSPSREESQSESESNENEKSKSPLPLTPPMIGAEEIDSDTDMSSEASTNEEEEPQELTANVMDAAPGTNITTASQALPSSPPNIPTATSQTPLPTQLTQPPPSQTQSQPVVRRTPVPLPSNIPKSSQSASIRAAAIRPKLAGRRSEFPSLSELVADTKKPATPAVQKKAFDPRSMSLSKLTGKVLKGDMSSWGNRDEGSSDDDDDEEESSDSD